MMLAPKLAPNYSGLTKTKQNSEDRDLAKVPKKWDATDCRALTDTMFADQRDRHRGLMLSAGFCSSCPTWPPARARNPRLP